MSEEMNFEDITVKAFLEQLRPNLPALEPVGGETLAELAELIGSRIYYAGHANRDANGNVPAPQQINFYELDFKGANVPLDLRVRRSGCVATGDWGAVSSELSYAMNPSNSFKNLNRAPFRDYIGQDRKKPLTQLSMLAPRPCPGGGASVDRCLYVFKLRNPGNRVDFRFSTQVAPLSIGEEYYEADCVGSPPICTRYQTSEAISLASLIINPNPPQSPPVNRRTYASNWLLEPAERGGTYPESVWACIYFERKVHSDPAEDFAISFNFHVEMRDRMTDNWVPIIIDPDIGHPGGNAAGP